MLCGVRWVWTLLREDVHSRPTGALMLLERRRLRERCHRAICRSAASVARERRRHLLRAPSRPALGGDGFGGRRLASGRAGNVVARPPRHRRGTCLHGGAADRPGRARGEGGCASGCGDAVEDGLDLGRDGDVMDETDGGPVRRTNELVLARVGRTAAARPARVLVARETRGRIRLGPLDETVQLRTIERRMARRPHLAVPAAVEGLYWMPI